MNKRFWLILYCIVLAGDLAGVYTANEALRNVTKPLLMPLLAGYFVLVTVGIISPIKKWIVLALVFSWAGDVLLMFDSSANFFIYGLIAFLIAHIFYILFYEAILRLEALKKNYFLFIPVLIYYVTLIYILSPHLGEMKLPVRIYGVVISYMLIQAFQVGRVYNKAAAWLMIAGSVLFITSDSILAINRFYKQFDLAGIAIMLTYGIAQLLIILGAAKYFSSIAKHKFAD